MTSICGRVLLFTYRCSVTADSWKLLIISELIDLLSSIPRPLNPRTPQISLLMTGVFIVYWATWLNNLYSSVNCGLTHNVRKVLSSRLYQDYICCLYFLYSFPTNSSVIPDCWICRTAGYAELLGMPDCWLCRTAGFMPDCWLYAGLLARSRYSEGPATGHLDTGFSWFPRVFKQMLRCSSCSPPDLTLLVTNFIFCIHVK